MITRSTMLRCKSMTLHGSRSMDLTARARRTGLIASFPQNYSNGMHLISARAIDTSGKVSPVVSSHVSFAANPGYYAQYLFPGTPGHSQQVCDNNVWSPDQPYDPSDRTYRLYLEKEISTEAFGR